MILSAFFTLSACTQDDDATLPENEEAPVDLADLILSEDLTLNPSGYAPLSALLSVRTDRPVRVDLLVHGENGPFSDVTHRFEEVGDSLNIPIHGLYANFNNTLDVSFFNSDGDSLGTQSYTLQTGELNPNLPEVTIETAQRERMAEGMTLVGYYGFSDAERPRRSFIFDSYGDIRWYLDFANHPDLNELAYGNGPELLANGNLFFGGTDTEFIYEIDLFGNVIDSWQLPGYTFHHEVIELPNGNFVACVDKVGASTIEDYIIEIDRQSKEIVTTWDLNESLDNTRRTLIDDEKDWVHVNGIAYDESDETLVVSGRTQGLIKLTWDNEVVWIMGAHKGWGTTGSGTDLTQYLLQPLDAAGEIITDPAVLDGDSNHPEFEWNWYQHAPAVLPSGNIMLFDNGENRNYTGAELYSRAVEYEIDAEAKTIQQTWQYGKELGGATYSRIVSDVDYLASQDHVLFSPGATSFGGEVYGKSVEIDHETMEVIFEATIKAEQTPASITLHRTERFTLYP